MATFIAGNDDVIPSRSHLKHLLLYLQFDEPCIKPNVFALLTSMHLNYPAGDDKITINGSDDAKRFRVWNSHCIIIFRDFHKTFFDPT